MSMHAAAATSSDVEENGAGTLRPHTRMRRAVVRTVSQSASIPQFTVDIDADGTALQQTRERLRQDGVTVSLTDLILHALARTLPAHPLLNASFTPEGTVEHRHINLAYLVEVPGGLLTPVIAGAEQLTLTQLASVRADLTSRATAARLTLEQLSGGTFTVSNLGAFGIRRFTAMVLPPQSAVLAVGAIDGNGRLNLTLTVDHRVVDGAPAARFANDLTEQLRAHPGASTPSQSTRPSPSPAHSHRPGQDTTEDS